MCVFEWKKGTGHKAINTQNKFELSVLQKGYTSTFRLTSKPFFLLLCYRIKYICIHPFYTTLLLLWCGVDTAVRLSEILHEITLH